MENKLNLEVKKVKKWNQDINVNFKELFKSLSSGTIAFVTSNVPELIKSGISTIDAISLKNKPQSLAYLLIFDSIQNSLVEILNENSDKLSAEFKTVERFEEYKEFQDLSEKIEQEIEQSELQIDISFFDNPTKITILEPIIQIFSQWLQIFGFNKDNAIITARKLNSYFVFNLHDKWRRNNEKFLPIHDQLNSPFKKATEIELEWKYYNSFLEKQIEKPIFNETFGLKEIFIPLNGYFESRVEDVEKNYIKEVVEVASYIKNWLSKNKNSEDCIKVICGGPGSGKSTVAKIFAAQVSKISEVNAIYIPLQHLNIKDDLTSSVGDYLKEANQFRHNPLDELHNNSNKLLLILDGLDELSKQGKHAYELAKGFIEEVQRKTAVINNDSIKLNVLLTGREMTIQNQSMAFRRAEQILFLLPYFNEYKDDFNDSKKLLNIDLRDRWWKTYGELKSLNYKRFPDELKNQNLDEITSQPLLNYLVALTYERNNIDFDEYTNLNEIFRDLIKAVFDRQYEKKQHKVLSELRFDENNFFRVLEEIAISAWHSGDIRTTTVERIDKHIVENNLKSFFQEFQMGVQAGISRLLTAFYFRQKGIDINQNKTFEFTHKSFGEYLASRRIINFLMLISSKIDRHDNDPDEGINRKDALKKIIETLGVTPIDGYLFQFLSNEIKLITKSKVERAQNNIIQLIEFSTKSGMPIELISPRPTFEEEQNYYRNSMLSLFIFLRVASDYTGIKSKINWESEKTFGNVISNLRALRISKSTVNFRKSDNDEINETNSLLNSCFSNMIIENCHLTSLDLAYSNFSNSKFTNVIFAGADLFGADFTNSIFQNINFYRTSLNNCIFMNVEFINYKPNHLLTIEQLKESSVLKDIKGLNDEMNLQIANELKRRKEERKKNIKDIKEKAKLKKKK